ncbi:DNA-directed RNA polymerases I, II, and III subunit RPABC1 [Neospora caninum Liverpool]|uniref:DNA-directed RNA polymerases I, II, and III subunit RPABC1 n=1 Tax=Neospora caninum (strain Liverpool) TaxID=572307 RepID=F0VDU4_NEOCL|nr:DNA-directed RNA polymerases I, II, and III subunit RPABC1 [Neospora caninum Liverpool]CBZ51887.1 DNA-directed RNA polymerases I, II, and III subunit RPABC1 [Neospora caninum Liverpool]|eukprot:XP_003881920.1 DNA-directed RNA polymerases I, II, and III subunit RPABC1 [Neospora caninum Liverpool]
MLLVASHKVDPDNRVIVYFADETKKTGVKPIRELTERMEERNIQRAILVTQNVLTAFARDAISEAAPRHIIENFMESELLVVKIIRPSETAGRRAELSECARCGYFCVSNFASDLARELPPGLDLAPALTFCVEEALWNMQNDIQGITQL